MFRRFELKAFKPGMVPGKRSPPPEIAPKLTKRKKTEETSTKAVTRRFQHSWKWDDEKGFACRDWLRYDAEKNMVFCDLCIQHETHARKNHIKGITNNFTN